MDDGSTIKCTAIQTDKGSILYNVSQNMTLRITKAVPLLAIKTSDLSIVTGVIIAVVLVTLMLIIILVIVFKKNKQETSYKEDLDSSQTSSKDDTIMLPIWTTKTGKH